MVFLITTTHEQDHTQIFWAMPGVMVANNEEIMYFFFSFIKAGKFSQKKVGYIRLLRKLAKRRSVV